ncbi:Rap guanine nucleotide exchange factor 1 [Nymphon striatum]|nr:Rap guanine nucleotide exchange factor 1 [Nymphon striatum]
MIHTKLKKANMKNFYFYLNVAHHETFSTKRFYESFSDPSPRKHGGRRLAERARSFREDIKGKFNQMRNIPAGSGSSTSPNKPSLRTKPKDVNGAMSSTLPREKKVSPQKEFELMLLTREKLLKTALRYFKDVVDKDKLEMLPGCATEVLEIVFAIHMILKKCLLTEQSSVVTSSTNQVYQSLASLIRWSDNLVLLGNKSPNTMTVTEVVNSVQDAVKLLIELVIEKLQTKSIKTNSQSGIYQTKPESPSSSSPLPDIPLTPREREILEQTNFYPNERPSYLNHSASSDSILNSANHNTACDGDWDIVPPKPPLSNINSRQTPASRPLSYDEATKSLGRHSSSNQFRGTNPAAPPLPPKRRSSIVSNTQNAFHDSFSSGQPLNLSSSFYDNADGTDLFSEFNEFRNDLTKSDISQSFNSDWAANRSPDSASSISKSPTSSLDSILDRSTEDVMMCVPKSASTSFYPMDPHMDIMGKNSVSVSSVSKSSREYKFSSYSSSNSSRISNQELCLQMSSMSTSSHHSSSSIHEQFASHSSCSRTSPPALPVKQRSVGVQKEIVRISPQPFVLSQEYKSVETSQSVTDGYLQHSSTSLSVNTPSSVTSCPVHGQSLENKPPPLPPKIKNIMAYMQMLGTYSCPSENEFYRHSVHTYNLAQLRQNQTEQQRCYTMYNSGMWSVSSSDKSSVFNDQNFSFGPSISYNRSVSQSSTSSSPPVLPPKKYRHSTSSLGRQKRSSDPTTPINPICPPEPLMQLEKVITPVADSSRISLPEPIIQPSKNDASEDSLLDQLDVKQYLVFKKDQDDGPDIRGGPIDALVMHATKSVRSGHFDLIYEEAFLATYRTFISTKELVEKLLYRYNKFINMSEIQQQRAARNAFSLLVRVVDDMSVGETESKVMNSLTNFVSQLLSDGELVLARVLREKMIEKCDARQRAKSYNTTLLPSMAISTRPSSLLDFKAKHLAKQMTLMDAELFHRIEIPEVLLWAKEQSEELSPNLTTFTAHFNKMSYWARSIILEQDEAKEREKYVLKFINIMKHLRLLNNFNSYLAILSALDSAPIRRLEWQKDITEGLKEYCQLIDSSSSFRAYRQALAETEPPCIPYIGLVLQDLTFVHIGNNDFLSDGKINFAKRWQQYNILDNMSRFRKCQYDIKKNERILTFFNNFDHYLCEEAMWQISESIKPRGGKKKVQEQS